MEPKSALQRPIIMSPLSVHPESLSLLAGRQSAAGGLVAGQAAAERFDAAALTPTFGVIGAPFLAAVAAAMSTRAAGLDAAAAGHGAQAAATAAGAAAYLGADAAGSAGMA